MRTGTDGLPRTASTLIRRSLLNQMARHFAGGFVAVLDAEAQQILDAAQERALRIGLVMKSEPAQPVHLCLLPCQENFDLGHATRRPGVARRKRLIVSARCFCHGFTALAAKARNPGGGLKFTATCRRSLRDVTA